MAHRTRPPHRAALDDLADKWESRYGAIIKLWENAWEEFIPFLDYDVEIKRVICSTNAIDSLTPGNAVPSRHADGNKPDGQCAGNQHSTHSPSPSATASRQLKPTHQEHRKHRS